jgi:hypothetical protein
MTKNKMILDIAYLNKNLEQNISLISQCHTVYLDPICIDENTFKNIFYQTNNFGIQNNPEFYEYTTFQTPWRTVSNRGFSLVDTILSNIEEDLNVTRNCFTTDTLIELTNELIKIKSLCDIPLCNMTSLSWDQIIQRIREKYINSHDSNKFEIVELNITVVIKVPLENSFPTHIKFTYTLDVNNNWITNNTC